MKTTVHYVGGVGFEAESRGHKVRTDLEVSNGGMDAAMSPPELLLASLGTCAAFYAMQYLNAHQMSAKDLVVEVNAEKAKNPARVGTFRIDVHGPEGVNPEGLKRAVEKCLVHNTLMHAPEIEVVVALASVAV